MTPCRKRIPAETMDEYYVGLPRGILTAGDRMQNTQVIKSLSEIDPSTGSRTADWTWTTGTQR
jgi:hypothetical protein